jgi:RNA polymerase sigma-70 factor (ECF subfamily)
VSRTSSQSSPLEPLLPAVARGEATAIKACLDRYSSLVWSLVRKAVRDHSQADDTVQEIFISLWKAADRFDPARGSEAVFVTTIARRRVIDLYRGGQRSAQFESIDDVVIPSTDSELERVDTHDEAARAMAGLEQLRPEQRRLLELWFVRGMTHSEIATSTGVPLGTVKSQIRRGLIRVREMIQSGQASVEVVT